MQKILFFIITFLSCSPYCLAQEKLIYSEFISIVKKYHPVAKQAYLKTDIAKAELQSAQGAFDPSVYFNKNEKIFGGKQYYSYLNSELKIPTWYGIDFKAGTENNQGQYTATELTKGRSSFIGAQVTLGKGLLIDKRRAVVKQAREMIAYSEEEQQLMLNDLLYEATSAYYEWQNAFFQKQLADSLLGINQERYQFIKNGVKLGDRPAIDTVETLAQLQSFEFLQAESIQILNNAGFELGNYLWLENQQAYQLPVGVQPEANTPNQPLMPLSDYLNKLITHPKLEQAQIKSNVLSIEKQLKFQSLLPTFNLNYNMLNKDYTFFNEPNLFQNNYKWGFTIGIPLFLREARAEYRKANLKITQQTWENRILFTELQNKVNKYFNDAVQLKRQFEIYQQTVANYQRLYQGELTKFINGESTLFLVNSRENKLFDAQQKLISLQTKVAKSIIGIDFATGRLAQLL
ncbi:TolC family protein [Emticicia sp. BO119]|uniref:TolC family protein n=1 Tax=Emticicia sp. BO119 TaxID=2757768 RepID=UPI0015F05D6B|nr:TolC family protein [Emticicia sp. BO119]MBA4853405.1 TolC family protein [Emticicia sp. BO119]